LRSVPLLRRVLGMDALLAAALFMVMAVLMFSLPARVVLGRLTNRWRSPRNILLRVLEALSRYGKVPGILFWALALSLLANLALIAVTAMALYAVSPDSFSLKFCLVAPIGHLVNSLPLTPGGIGVGEAAFNSLFALAGINGGAQALLCLRIWTLLVGSLGLVNYFFGMGRIVHWQKEHSERDQPGTLEAGSSTQVLHQMEGEL
jgi:uncharacterized membrane protein YbhN (UPF0104 family)